MDFYSILYYGIVLLFFVYFLFDLNHCIRTGLTAFFARYFRKKIQPLAVSVLYGMVLPVDADFFIVHMNNSRYFRELDFSRVDSLMRNGLFDMVRKNGGGGEVAAQCLRYRQPMMMFSLYKIESAVVFWESKFLYFEHRFITIKDGIVRCLGYSKLAFNFDIREAIGERFPNLERPVLPDDLEKWIDYNAFNSKKINGITRSLL